MSLHRLLFDTANPAESANVGAYVRAGTDGDLISSTLVSGKEGLDVNLINASIAVTATNLDIRDLVFATDKVDVSGSSVSISGDVNVTQGTSPWVVSATDLDIRDLTAASDSVDSWLNDGAGTALTSTLTGGKQALDVYVANTIDVDDGLANTAIDASTESVSVTGALIASPLASRKYVYIYNHGNKEIYIGQSGVATGDGFPIFPGALLEARIGASVAIHAVAASGTQDIRVLQAS